MVVFFNQRKDVILWYGGIIGYAAVLIFLGMSLVSYTTTDSSWLYVSTDPGPIVNWCGFLGAQVAALLFYLLGGASFLLFIPLLCAGFIFFTQRSLKLEWERLGASLYCVFGGAAVLTTYGIDCALSPYPGGFVGLLFAQKLLYYGDPIGRMLFLYSSLCASIILLCRWSFMFLIRHVVMGIGKVCAMMRKYQVIEKAIYVVRVTAYTVFIRPPLFFITFVQSLLNGQAFNETGLLYPEDTEDEYSNDFDMPIHKIDDAFTHVSYVVISLSQPIGRTITGVMMAPVVMHLTKKSERIIISSYNDDAYTGSVKDDQECQQQPVLSMTKKVSQYTLPQISFFMTDKQSQEDKVIEKELQERAHVLQDKLKRFGVNGEVTAIKHGPVVTLFEYQPDIDTKLSKIVVLEDDLAMALQAMSIRIIAPIPGRSVVGFEVSNSIRHDVLFSQVIYQTAYTQFAGNLPLVLGKGTIGEAVVVDLAKMPHLLIAGSTGSGKSVALNALLISLLCKLSPDELKLILIDPKRLEFAAFTDIAHLLFPIVTSPYQAAPVLRWVVQEMEERYEKMARSGARNIGDYNLRKLQHDADTTETMPYIVVVIDELADLMITAGRDIEDLITRITQMARAAGIHMIVATQRPSVDVITGLIKANFPSRISFKVASRIDSRTILDTMGADRLLGRGDMLFLDASTSQLRRVHGAYVSDKEIEEVADYIRQQRKVEYLDIQQTTALHGQELSAPDDILYKDVCTFLDEIDEISISLLQRRFRIGYNRSARIIDMLESQGLIMPQDGGKTRKVIR